MGEYKSKFTGTQVDDAVNIATYLTGGTGITIQTIGESGTTGTGGIIKEISIVGDFVDKVTDTASYYRLYGINTDGSQGTVNMTVSATPNTVVKRTGYGRVKTVEGVEDDDAVNVGQAVKVLSGKTQTPMTIGIEDKPYSFVQRDESGFVQVEVQNAADDSYGPVPKKQLETELSHKVEKITTTGSRARAYIVDMQGQQGSLMVDWEANGTTIAGRTDDGRLKAKDATETDDVVNLSQLNGYSSGISNSTIDDLF